VHCVSPETPPLADRNSVHPASALRVSGQPPAHHFRRTDFFLATLHASSQFLALLALFSALKSVIGRRPGCLVRLIYLGGTKKAVDT